MFCHHVLITIQSEELIFSFSAQFSVRDKLSIPFFKNK